MDTRRWMLPGLAAGAVVAVAAGVVLGLGGRDPDRPPVAAAPAPATSVPAADPADLLVRDGDQVAVSGEVRAVPGRPVRICAPLAVAAPGYEPGQEPAPEYCEAGVTVRGLDLATITGRTLHRGVVSGRARVEGRYAVGVVTVARQAPPDPEADRPSALTEHPPCPPPAGGWQAGQDRADALVSYLAAHPDQYVDSWVTYPDGYPKSDDGSTPQAYTTVSVVGTVLDPAAVEPALRKVHRGNLCVVRVTKPKAVLDAVTQRLVTGETGFREHGVYSVSPDGITGRVDVELVVLDAAAQRWLRQADDRTGTVTPHPWVRPLRPR